MKTIAAIATPHCVGGIGVIRISGEKSIEIADKVFCAKSGKKIAEIKGYSALLGMIYDQGKKIDEVVALKFISPKSYTGEDVVEFSCHGGIFITEKILSLIIREGAVLAEPGEFTKRAFENGKIDLIEAEAVADLIAAEGEIAHEAALSLKEGALSKEIAKVTACLLLASANMSAYVDYPDDDIPDLSPDKLKETLTSSKIILERLLLTFEAGQIYKEGIRTVIVGKPNVGKSTLMNMLIGYDKSIVTNIAGTTRDIVEETISLDGIKLHLFDTAGIRNTDDEVEKIGVIKAKEKLQTASLVIAVFDNTTHLSKDDQVLIKKIKSRSKIAVINKIDLNSKIDAGYIKENFEYTVMASAKENIGREEIKKAIEQMYQLNMLDPTAATLATRRQKDAVKRAKDAISNSIETLDFGLTPDAVSVDIDIAINALYELTGERVTELVTQEVFSHFCVGK